MRLLSTAVRVKVFGGFFGTALLSVSGQSGLKCVGAFSVGGARFGSTSDEVLNDFIDNFGSRSNEIFNEMPFGNRARGLDGDGGDAASTSINGYVIIAGYDGGIDPKTGKVNDTLVVEYDLQGCNGTCSILELEEKSNYCEYAAIGELDPDDTAGDVVIVDNIDNINSTSSDVEIIDVDMTINQLFNRSMVVQDAKGRVLACAMFKEITNTTNTEGTEGEIAVDDKTLSGAISSASSSAAWVFFVACTMVIAAVL